MLIEKKGLIDKHCYVPYSFSKIEICHISYASKTIIEFIVKLYNELNQKNVVIFMNCKISDIIDNHKEFPIVQNFENVYGNLIQEYILKHFDQLIIPQLIHHI